MADDLPSVAFARAALWAAVIGAVALVLGAIGLGSISASTAAAVDDLEAAIATLAVIVGLALVIRFLRR